MGGKRIVSGQKFGKLTVLREIEPVLYKNGNVKRRLLCICVCGAETTGTMTRIRNGEKQSCRRCGKGGICNRKTTAKDTSYKGMFGIYKTRARKSSIPFELTLEDVKELILDKCFYCASPPSREWNVYGDKWSQEGTRASIRPDWAKNGWITINGIDRKDNTLGYTKENCVPCCKTCNYAKHVQSCQDFLNLVKKIYENHNLSNSPNGGRGGDL